MEAQFYKRNSGVRVVEELFCGAVEQADSFQKVLNEYTRFHLASERLKELQPQLDTQKKKVDELRKELEKTEKKKNLQNQVTAIQEEYRIESAALDELARCVNVLNGVKQPVFPSWLSDFLREVVA